MGKVKLTRVMPGYYLVNGEGLRIRQTDTSSWKIEHPNGDPWGSGNCATLRECKAAILEWIVRRDQPPHAAEI